MRTLLRHALTGQYYQSDGKWTTNPRRAHDFGMINEAMRFAHKIKSHNMEVNLTFDRARDAAAVRLVDCL